MENNTQRLLMGAAGAAGGAVLGVEDVFSTYLYTGNGSTQTISGLDFSPDLVWIKCRSSAFYHRLYDQIRGVTKALYCNSTDTEGAYQTTYENFTSFNSDGFSLGTAADDGINRNGSTFAAWTFRKAEKFFDVVTYTGSGANRTVSHNLGSVPGTIIVKRTDSTGDWQVYHRSLANTEYLVLNSIAAKATGATRWNSTTPTSTVFSLGTDATVNASGGTYVAYLFAHDAGGFGDDGSESVIKCGSYTGNGSTSGPVVDLGWEPQWVMVKCATMSGLRWMITDTMRGMSYAGTNFLAAEVANAEIAGSPHIVPNSSGFQLVDVNGNWNASGLTYIYIAIRRGPMKTPTSGTEVFNTQAETPTGSAGYTLNSGSGFPVDWIISKQRVNTNGPFTTARLTNNYLQTSSASAEAAYAYGYDVMSGVKAQWDAGSTVSYAFRRAPGFFDVVAYTGTGVARTVSHNLGVAPELMIVKARDLTWNWNVYHAGAGDASHSYLDGAGTFSTNSLQWNNTNPGITSFSVGSGARVNAPTYNYIAYLFATLPGVSKVGSYTGTGTTLNVDCGFTAGARFVMIKRTDSTGDWYVWDTARGIIAANDPYLLLNSTAAEVTSTDYIDPLSSGFQISSTAPAAINADGGSYIFLSIA